ncbi:MAG TPA: EamA family transporter [Spirochaetia bacterium]|nr:EamA family transporter [Spirochaetia bacterium]
MKRLEMVSLILLGLIWGSSFLFIKVALADIPPLTLVFIRIALGALCLLIVLRFQGKRMPAFGPVWGAFFLMGLLNGAVPYTLISIGEVTIDSGLAAILNATMPIFTLILAHFLTEDEPLSWERSLGVAVGLLGVIVLVGVDALLGIGTHFWSQMAVIGAAVSYALATIVGRRFLKGYPAIVAATGQLIGGAVLMAPLSLILDTPWKLNPSWLSVGTLLALSIVGTSVAYLFYFYLLNRVGATRTSMVTYIVPLTGVLWGAVFLGERFHWWSFLALGLILIGVTGSSGRFLRGSALRRKHSKNPDLT